MIVLFFTRGDELLRVEARLDHETDEYVLAVKGSEGRVQTERIADAGTLRRTLAELEGRLTDEQWVRTGIPIVVPETGAV